jgi:nucleoside-diphosphate-sugar epimerase
VTSIRTVAELEENLSRPTEADVAALAEIKGDLLIIGAGGKMGPTLSRLARRAADQARVNKKIVAVSRFTDENLHRWFSAHNIETIACDLLEHGALAKLPDAPNVIFMAARKFGTSGAEHLTWAMNTFLPGLVAERFRDSRIVTFSTGNVYPLTHTSKGGSVESDPLDAKGEYAQSALGRERMFEYGSHRWGTPVTILRLNYAVELRYGVLVDIALAVFEQRPIDLRMGHVNVIWQRDANSYCLRSFACCQAPPCVLNVTGPGTLSVRAIAQAFGGRFNRKPIFSGEETDSALLSNAGKAHKLFGCPTVSAEQAIDWVADWITHGGSLLNKPTHFATRDGQF